METRQTQKEKFNRIYYVWNPSRFTGPPTNVVGTILTPKSKENS